jgi:cytochrome P450
MTMTKAPGFTQLFPLPYGPLRALRSDPLGSQRQILAQYGEIVRVRIGPVLGHFLFHPDQVREVLHDRQKNYLRGWQYALMRRLFGDNLVVSEGDYWARQRRLAQPAFHRQRLAGYAEVMIDETAGLVTRWQRMADAGQAIDATPEMARLALAVAGRTLFSRDVSQEADSVGRAFGIVGPYLEYRFNRPFTSLPAWVPTSRNRRFQSAARTLNELVMEYIVERRREEGDRGDLLSMLMQIRDEDTGESMTDEQVRSEALTFLIAGHETTATALAWTWFYLGTHPAAQDRVRE